VGLALPGIRCPVSTSRSWNTWPPSMVDPSAGLRLMVSAGESDPPRSYTRVQ